MPDLLDFYAISGSPVCVTAHRFIFMCFLHITEDLFIIGCILQWFSNFLCQVTPKGGPKFQGTFVFSSAIASMPSEMSSVILIVLSVKGILPSRLWDLDLHLYCLIKDFLWKCLMLPSVQISQKACLVPEDLFSLLGTMLRLGTFFQPMMHSALGLSFLALS